MDPNLLNQLLQLLGQRGSTGPLTLGYMSGAGSGGWLGNLVQALGGQPGTTTTSGTTTSTTTPTTTPVMTKPSVGSGQRQALLNSGYDARGNWMSSSPNPNPFPAATADPYSPSGGQSWYDYYQQQMQQLPAAPTYSRPGTGIYLRSDDPSGVREHRIYPGISMAAPQPPYAPNPYWAGTPAQTKWSLGPDSSYYNGVVQNYSGYVPPTPTGKWSVRPFLRSY